jgi:8-oxo-dGTP pyrophosphatase MutT (NUDIX family)
VDREPEVVRDLVQEFGGKRFRMVTRLDAASPPLENISTAHCLAFDENRRIVLTLHHERDWTIPGGHLEPGETALDAMAREALEEAGAIVTDGVLFAHEEIEPEDGVAADPRYPVPSFQLFFASRLVSLGQLSATDECSEARLFTPAEARVAPGWIQRNLSLYEAALGIVGGGLPPQRRT